jgi:hypothetical protein
VTNSRSGSVFVDAAEEAEADRYEAVLIEAERRPGRQMVRAICGHCEGSHGQPQVGSVFESKFGPLWRSEIFLGPMTAFKNEDEGRQPPAKGVVLALLGWPKDRRRRGNGQVMMPQARCEDHGVLRIDEVAISEAVNRFKRNASVQVLPLEPSA